MGVLAFHYPGPQVRGCLLRVWLSERTAKREIPLHLDVQVSRRPGMAESDPPPVGWNLGLSEAFYSGTSL
jgi:hypothetical protein